MIVGCLLPSRFGVGYGPAKDVPGEDVASEADSQEEKDEAGTAFDFLRDTIYEDVRQDGLLLCVYLFPHPSSQACR